MKKAIILTIDIILTLLTPFLTLGILWFTLERFDKTFIGEFILRYLTSTYVFWITISMAIFVVLLLLVKIILRNSLKAKVNNFFIHFNTWVACLIVAGLTGITFYEVAPLITESINITQIKKIGIAIILLLLISFHIISSKVLKVVERKLIAYDTSIEMNTVGRGSVILNNILKLIQLIFPEILILILICLIVSWNVSNYFVLLLIACLVPVVGNIISDFNTRAEIRKNNKKKEDEMINKIANKVKR